MTDDYDEDAPTVRCNRCGWTGQDRDLEFVDSDAEDGEPAHACPNCATDHFLMAAPWEYEI